MNRKKKTLLLKYPTCICNKSYCKRINAKSIVFQHARSSYQLLGIGNTSDEDDLVSEVSYIGLFVILVICKRIIVFRAPC